MLTLTRDEDLKELLYGSQMSKLMLAARAVENWESSPLKEVVPVGRRFVSIASAGNSF